jgi:hypothetical protein
MRADVRRIAPPRLRLRPVGPERYPRGLMPVSVAGHRGDCETSEPQITGGANEEEGIDLDPATSEIAQKTVRASNFSAVTRRLRHQPP